MIGEALAGPAAQPQRRRRRRHRAAQRRRDRRQAGLTPPPHSPSRGISRTLGPRARLSRPHPSRCAWSARGGDTLDEHAFSPPAAHRGRRSRRRDPAPLGVPGQAARGRRGRRGARHRGGRGLLQRSVGVLYVLLVLVAGSALWLAGRLVRWFATSLVVTNTRIVQRIGRLLEARARAPAGAGQPAVVPPVDPGSDPAHR